MDNYLLLIIIFAVIIAVILMFLLFSRKSTVKNASYDKIIRKANKMVQDICAAIDEDEKILVLNSMKNDVKNNIIYINFDSRSEREIFEHVILQMSILLSEKHKSYKIRDLRRKI